MGIHDCNDSIKSHSTKDKKKKMERIGGMEKDWGYES